MHEETGLRVRRIYIIGWSLPPSGHVFYNLPLLLLDTDLSVCLTDPVPHHPHRPPSPPEKLQPFPWVLFFSAASAVHVFSPSVYPSVHRSGRLHETTQALWSLRRINQASATWPRWLRSSWAQLIRVPCGHDMRRTKKAGGEGGGGGQKDQQAINDYDD